MTPTSLILSKPIQIVISVVIAAALAAFTVSYVKDQSWKRTVESKTQQIQLLEESVAKKDMEIAALNIKIGEATIATAEATKIAKNAQANTNELLKKWKELQAQLHPNIPPDSLPSIPPVESDYTPIANITTLTDCTKTLEAERKQCTEEKTVLVEEIVADRNLITTVTTEKDLISQKADILTTEVTGLKEIKTEQEVIIDTQGKQIKSEVRRKKIYRGASGILALIVTVLLL
jgi:hypothetical protein